MTVRLLHGDCRQAMAGIADGEFDAIVTDPPYSLEFMGKAWDSHSAFDDDPAFGYYLAGLIDGEGCFRAQRHERGTHTCTFSLKLRRDDRPILEKSARYTGAGTVQDINAPSASSPQATWVVQDKEGCQRLVDALDKYPLRAKKSVDYLSWREAVCEWTNRPRGNRWSGPADQTRAAVLKKRIEDSRRYTDPPWSGNGYQDWCRMWAEEAYRVLKPGGHLIAFGGTRTYHRMACAIEDAGFEIRDSLHWIHGSGFPKSLNVSKAIDKAARGVPQGGADPTSPNHGKYRTQATEGKRWDGDNGQGFGAGGSRFLADGEVSGSDTEPAESGVAGSAAEWDGWGTALKPAHEPIILARKPLAGTVVANVLEHGTGALNIDGCKVGATVETWPSSRGPNTGNSMAGGVMARKDTGEPPAGRWPPNLLLTHSADCVRTGDREVRGCGGPKSTDNGDTSMFGIGQPGHVYGEKGKESVPAYDCAPDCPVAGMDGQSGIQKSGITVRRNRDGSREPGEVHGNYASRAAPDVGYGDTGGASRFFPSFEWSPEYDLPFLYCAKAPKKERPVVEGLPGHPTVKPLALMRWLVRLVTPPDGKILDPFAGTGTTGEAAELEMFDCLMIEQDPDSIRRIEKRMEKYSLSGLVVEIPG